MIPDRWLRCEEIYANAGAPAKLRTHEDLGHGTYGRLHSDVAAFLSKVAIDRASV
jgi:hypothetical protein